MSSITLVNLTEDTLAILDQLWSELDPRLRRPDGCGLPGWIGQSMRKGRRRLLRRPGELPFFTASPPAVPVRILWPSEVWCWCRRGAAAENQTFCKALGNH
jgi:hypothetical protein